MALSGGYFQAGLGRFPGQLPWVSLGICSILNMSFADMQMVCRRRVEFIRINCETMPNRADSYRGTPGKMPNNCASLSVSLLLAFRHSGSWHGHASPTIGNHKYIKRNAAVPIWSGMPWNQNNATTRWIPLRNPPSICIRIFSIKSVPTITHCTFCSKCNMAATYKCPKWVIEHEM